MSNEKMAVCKDLRADVCINYKIEDFLKMVKEETGGFFFFNIETSIFLNVYRDWCFSLFFLQWLLGDKKTTN